MHMFVRLSLFRNLSVIMLPLVAVCMAAPSFAFEEVRVFQPRQVLEEGAEEPRELSPSKLRSETLMLGFAEGVVQTALGMLPEVPSEQRLEIMRAFFKTKAGEWVLGYKEIASTATEEGLSMVLEVDVNRRAVREAVENLGLDRPAGEVRYVTLLPMPTLTEADKADLAAAMQLVNAAERPGFGPSFQVERLETGTLRGSFTSSRGGWTAMDADVASVWLMLWQKYNSGRTAATQAVDTTLTVTGWFTPGGAHDFDRALQGWDTLVRFARLVEMDLETAGVSARWEIQPVNSEGLRRKLQTYLPPRGLEFTLSAAN